MDCSFSPKPLVATPSNMQKLPTYVNMEVRISLKSVLRQGRKSLFYPLAGKKGGRLSHWAVCRQLKIWQIEMIFQYCQIDKSQLKNSSIVLIVTLKLLLANRSCWFKCFNAFLAPHPPSKVHSVDNLESETFHDRYCEDYDKKKSDNWISNHTEDISQRTTFAKIC